MKAAFLAMLLAGSFVAVGSSTDKDDLENINPNGRPRFSVGSNAAERCAIWHDSGGWHLRTTCPKTSAHQYSIVMQIQDGKVGELKPISAEKSTSKKGVPADQGVWNKERTRFQFTMNTAKSGEDGYDFDVSAEATSIKFTVKIDGRDVTDVIIIGSKNEHPAKSTFSLPAHPMREKKKN